MERVLRHRRAERRAPLLPVGNELVQGPRLQHRAGQDVGADLGALLQDADGDLPAGFRRKLLQPDRGGQARGPGADDHDVVFHGFAHDHSNFSQPAWILSAPSWTSTYHDLCRQGAIEFWQNCEQVANDPIVGNLEDRRFLILVDRDDDFGILHAGEMLDRSRNSDRDIEIRRNNLPRLTNLPVVRGVTGIDGGTRGRSEEHTSELQSLMRISYAVFCVKKTNNKL